MSLGRATRPWDGASRMPRNGARTVSRGPGDSNVIRLLDRWNRGMFIHVGALAAYSTPICLIRTPVGPHPLQLERLSILRMKTMRDLKTSYLSVG